MDQLKKKYTQSFIRQNHLVLAEAIIGSHAFDLHNEKSDQDLYGVFILDSSDLYSLQYRIDSTFKDVVEKESPMDDDITYMEVGKFFELLNKNNPNALELLAAIQEKGVNYAPIHLDMSKILSKLCEKTFADYAIAQIKKARGLNKKIVNPMGEERKTPLDFCYFIQNEKTIPLRSVLRTRGLDQLFCGIVAVPNARDSYGLYYDNVSDMLFSGKYIDGVVETMKEQRRIDGRPMGYGFKGIEMENSNEIRLSSVPKLADLPSGEVEFIGNISYNKDGYIKHCKDYLEYQEWITKRNPERYNNNLKQNYDTKNISHCIRLLSVAKEIGEGKGLILKRTADRQFIMDVKYGNVEYDVAMEYAENIMKDLPEIYKNSNLRDIPDFEYLNTELIILRKSHY